MKIKSHVIEFANRNLSWDVTMRLDDSTYIVRSSAGRYGQLPLIPDFDGADLQFELDTFLANNLGQLATENDIKVDNASQIVIPVPKAPPIPPEQGLEASVQVNSIAELIGDSQITFGAVGSLPPIQKFFDFINHGWIYMTTETIVSPGAAPTTVTWICSVSGKWTKINSTPKTDAQILADLKAFKTSGKKFTENDVKTDDGSARIV